MSRHPVLASAIAALAMFVCCACAPAAAQAQATPQETQCVRLMDGTTACPSAQSKCVKDRYGDWFCSARGGDARLDRYGEPVCGAGACVVDIHGEVQCSTESHGTAAIDITSRAVCTAGCARATAGQCRKLVR
ncbi:hypothetical protein [Caenimonas aquaedulcis]|uniref:Lipoprotein n=1 Tax=Caenimonas aquaedulcis TaxID=2793270 RepID=A0A931H8Z8_9BURK|nr:hypothetical protein [Caenimonas aquaedulcis]MBG9390525.1 hypothetical protein [Caenimonas aquaedulcis]